jgi:hypothetical protein
LKTYKPAVIDNLPSIADQILGCLSTLPEGSSFFIQDTDYIKSHCPALGDYLDSIDLYQRWCYTGIAKLDACGVLPLHSDGKCRWALNLPILNCQQSYTIWYDAKPKEDITKPVVIDGVATTASYVKYKEETAVEIDRVCSDQALWVNVHTPHSAINYSDKPRIILSLRFSPELDDILNK